MRTIRRLGIDIVGVLVGAVASGCTGASTVSRLPNTQLERGAHGPFVASFVSFPRAGASAPALNGEFQEGLQTRARADGWLGEYLVADASRFGLITLWRGAEQERAFHGPAWLAAESARRGVAPTVERFDVPVWIDSGRVPEGEHGVVVFVSVPLPWFRPRGMVESKIIDRVPEYQSLAALDRKYFILMDPGRTGGIYLWHERGDAEAYYDGAWHARVKERYGTDADMRTLDVLALSVPPFTLAPTR